MSERRLQPNAIKEVAPYIEENPFGIDIVVKGLQSAYSDELEWLEKSFARAVVRSEQRGEVAESGELTTNYIYPAIFVQKGYDFLNMLELDNWDAYSFFIARDPEDVLEFEEGIRNTYERTLSSIFWFNLERVKPSRQTDYLEELKREIIEVITNAQFPDTDDGGSVLGVEIDEIFDEPENIFEGFSVELEKSQLLYFPYRGLRIDLLCKYVDECEDC